MNSTPNDIDCQRLQLRRWRQADRLPFAAMNTDARVMEFFPHQLNIVESDALVNRINTHFDDNGFGMWAVEEKESGSFMGFIGLAIPRFEAHFTPCVEIGWRLDAVHWGRGYATEGARAALQFAFDHLGLEEVVAMTSVGNLRSRRVMEKIGMKRSPTDDFDHPMYDEGHPHQRHVLYRVQRCETS